MKEREIKGFAVLINRIGTVTCICKCAAPTLSVSLKKVLHYPGVKSELARKDHLFCLPFCKDN